MIPAHISGRDGGELGVQIRSEGEKGRRDVFYVEVIGLQHSGEELFSGFEDGFGGVCLYSGGPSHAPGQHAETSGWTGGLARAKNAGLRAATIDTADGILAVGENPSGLKWLLYAGR